jgi:hypothetical protein
MVVVYKTDHGVVNSQYRSDITIVVHFIIDSTEEYVC